LIELVIRIIRIIAQILYKMDIEEIKCSLCSEIYNETDKMPILLPDCGHSFCLTCINRCFEELQ